MGGVAKGLLLAPDSSFTLVERMLGELARALPGVATLLVGNADPYSGLALPQLADEPADIGPLGGLSALLLHAERAGAEVVLALACDLPFVSAELIARLASEAPGAAALVARQQQIRNPLFARYQTAAGLDAVKATLASGRRSLQAVLDCLGPSLAELSLSASEEALLADWDTPGDMAGQAKPDR